MSSKYFALIKDTLLFALGSIGSKLILFAMVPIYTNYLSEAEYGISELVFSTAQLLIPFFSLVIFEAVIRFGLSKEDNTADVLLVGLLVFGAGSILTVAVTPLFGLYAALSQWKWHMCVYIILNMLCTILGCYVKAVGKNKLYAAVNILQTFVMALLNVLLMVVWNTGVQGYLLSTIFACVVADAVFFLFGGMARDLKKSCFRPELMKKMVVYAAPLILNNVSWWAIHSSDKIMIELMIGPAALGIYTVATKIPALINVVISIFSQAWNISSVKEIEGDNDAGFYSGVFAVYQTLTFGAVIVLNGVVKPFMSVYVGEDFSSAWKYVPVLLAAAGFSAVSSYFGSMYGAMKKSINSMATTLSAAVVNVVLNFFMIRKWGVWGAIVATLTAYILLSTLRMVDVKRHVRIKIPVGQYVINVGLILVQAVLVALDYHVYLVSLFSIALYAVINMPTLLKMAKSTVLGERQ